MIRALGARADSPARSGAPGADQAGGSRSWAGLCVTVGACVTSWVRCPLCPSPGRLLGHGPKRVSLPPRSPTPGLAPRDPHSGAGGQWRARGVTLLRRVWGGTDAALGARGSRNLPRPAGRWGSRGDGRQAGGPWPTVSGQPRSSPWLSWFPLEEGQCTGSRVSQGQPGAATRQPAAGIPAAQGSLGCLPLPARSCCPPRELREPPVSPAQSSPGHIPVSSPPHLPPPLLLVLCSGRSRRRSDGAPRRRGGLGPGPPRGRCLGRWVHPCSHQQQHQAPSRGHLLHPFVPEGEA